MPTVRSVPLLLEVDALEVEGLILSFRPVRRSRWAFHSLDGVAARHAADVEDELPELRWRQPRPAPKIFAHGALGMAAMDSLDAVVRGVLRHGAMNLRCAAFTRLIFAPSRPA